MPGKVFLRLGDLAMDQHGYFTTAQARAAGASNQALHSLLRTGSVERVSWAVYRVPSLPASPLGPYMAATLWPRGGGVLSHETALEVYDLSDTNPSKIHITVPTRFRNDRPVPASYVLHRANLDPDEIGRVEGVPVTKPARAIRDCHAEHIGTELLLQAIGDGFRMGYLSRQDADELSRLVAA